MGTLDGQIAVVTGAARGIGRGIALTLAKEGAVIIAADLDLADAEATAAAARESSPKSIACKIDIADIEQIQRFVPEVVSRFGGVDILINNAGVTRKIDFFDIVAQDMDWILGVNIRGTFFMMQAVAAEMRKVGAGRIVNIASIAGKGYRNTSNICYAGSKGAIITMTRVAAAYLGQFGITVNSVCPGLTETEMMLGWIDRRAAAQNVPPAEVKAELTKDIALGRTNSVSDIALSVLFLVSQSSRNITGQSLNVDGGMIWD